MSGKNNVISLLRQLLTTSEEYDSRALGMVLSKKQFSTVLQKERHRSDRLKAPFSLVVIPADIKAPQQLQKLARFVQDHMRIIDEFGWYDEKNLAILMFDTPFEGARIALKRLSLLDNAPQELLRSAIHVYPDASETIYTNQANKRQRERLNMELSAQVIVSERQGPSGTIEVVTQDISSQGAFLVTNTPLAEGTEVVLDIDLPLDSLNKLHGSTAKLHANGRIVRTSDDGMAVAFTEECEVPPIDELLGS